MPTILTFGDSNTHGTPPITDRTAYARHAPGIRWPTVMAARLRADWWLVEEGLPGRTAQFDDPTMDGLMNGHPALRQALQSHGPLDVLTIMLGTNDVKTRFGATPHCVMAGLAGLLDLALGAEMQARHGGFRLLLIAPPPVQETGLLAADFWGGAEKSRALAPLLAGLARARGVGFLDAGQVVSVSPVDGVHLDVAAHRTLGEAVAQAVQAL
ncbi:GDSL-type esterase/lipase family protein [Pararhodobacter sp.]|jgi:lysophospholipase L1-like esterase|uniref:GDSL-type esterase/lipase family protein n=1 Tax=Pararhodobacter sp. TaxID=2127056 RepID=UPI002FDE3A03